MPCYRAEETQAKEMGPGVKVQFFINRERGAGSVTLAKAYMEPGSSLPLHSHRVEDAFIILSGKGKCTVGDETYEVGPDTAVLVPAGVKHNCTNDGNEPMIVIFTWPSVEVERFPG